MTGPQDSDSSTESNSPPFIGGAIVGDHSPGSLEGLAAAALADADRLAEKAAHDIMRNIDGYRLAGLTFSEVRQGCVTTLTSALLRLESGMVGDVDDQVTELGALRHRQGVPLDLLMRTLQMEAFVLWNELAPVEGAVETIGSASDRLRLWKAIDEISSQLARAYKDDAESQRRDATQRREQLIDSVLTGTASEHRDIWSVLDLPAERPVVIVVAEINPSVSTHDLARMLRLCSIPSAWRSRPDFHVGVVVPPVDGASATRVVLDALEGVRAGVSTPCAEPALIPRASDEAHLALAALGPARTGPTTIFEHCIATLVARDLELATRLSEHFLRPVLERPTKERDTLIETLIAFNDTRGSVAAAAGRLFVHRNTVLNRLAKISELTGASFTDPAGIAEINLAVVVMHLRGMKALSG